MARLARLVVPGLPHHITQRGNRRQQVFFDDGRYAAYIELLSEWCGEFGVEIWSYCLMRNHLIAVPSSDDGLRWAIGETHQRDTRRINFREKWRGYLWQGRFASFVMDEPYLLAAARYLELNPVRARRVRVAGDWPWRSAKAHLCAGRSLGPSCSAIGDGSRLECVLEKRQPEEDLGSFAGTSALLARSETRHSLDGSERDRWPCPQASETWTETEGSCDLSVCLGAGLRTAVISGSSRAARAVRTEVAAGRLRGTALLGTWQKTRSS